MGLSGAIRRLGGQAHQVCGSSSGQHSSLSLGLAAGTSVCPEDTCQGTPVLVCLTGTEQGARGQYGKGHTEKPFELEFAGLNPCSTATSSYKFPKLPECHFYPLNYGNTDAVALGLVGEEMPCHFTHGACRCRDKCPVPSAGTDHEG